MFYNPSQYVCNDFYRVDQMNSYARILNASPNSPPIDVYLDDKLIAKNIAYKEFSKYLIFPKGNNNIKVYPTGQNVNPIIDSPIALPPGFVYNIAAIGYFPNIILYPIPEPTTPQNFNRACVRLINLSPNSPPLDIRVQDGTKIFSSVKYEDYTTYACIPPGTYTFRVIATGTNNVLFTIPDVQLMPNKYYAIYTVGVAGGSPPLEAFIIEEVPPIPR
ncbi:DUF4397 domain-containing protein [Clostridium magnum]|uniref:DUF4397 domain-containing protein n=1 Tax=Clostridium magnum DSM 2767 TaxID=1121326 RepID=A0A162S4T5_9CLOT|nr:DUF4397 domain-containing protein [Clostridium magnum]KZL90771.1 hypothetical protein CLMAG_36820 [Clostridium magnum DSM 2767]SHI11256.1 protein of unknown function [Clostridium magnum DSM 2767]